MRFTLFVSCLAVFCAPTQGVPPLHKVASVNLPDTPTRFDYQSIDPRSGRLYLSHMGAGKLIVFDTKTNKILANLAGYKIVTGVLAVPEEGKFYGSAVDGFQIGKQGLKSIGKFSAPAAHTVSVDQKTHRVYVALKSVNGRPELWILEPPK